jgi:hypothetical protein
MNTLVRRLGNLENVIASTESNYVVLFAHVGESSKDCILRHGHKPDDRVLVISFVGIKS